MVIKSKILIFSVVIFGGLFLAAPKIFADSTCTSSTISGNINSDMTCDADQGPFTVHNTTIKSGAMLTFEEGSVIKISGDADITVKSGSSLNLNGTDENSISVSTSTTEFWGQIKFESGSTGSFQHVQIKYGGKDGHTKIPVIQNEGADLNFNNVVFEENQGPVIYHSSASSETTINDSSFVNNGTVSADHYVFKIEQGSLTLENVTTSGNQGIIKCSKILKTNYKPVLTISNSSFSDTTDLMDTIAPIVSIYHYCEINESNVSWPSVNTNWVLLVGDLVEEWTLPSFGGTPIITNTHFEISGEITFSPGAVFKLSNGAEFLVSGELTAIGTESQPIVFSGYYDDETVGDTDQEDPSPDPVDKPWKGMRFKNNSGAAKGVLEHVFFKYGGFENEGSLYAGRNAEVVVKNINISNAAGSRCVYVENEGELTIEQSDFSVCDLTAIESDNSSEIVNAENNYWGDPTGPYHSFDNPEGQGKIIQSSSGLVDFTPWLESLETEEEEEMPSSSGPQPVIIPPVMHAELSVSSYRIFKGESVTLNWKVSGAKVVKLYPSGDSLRTQEGFINVSPNETTTFKLEAINDGFTKSTSITVVVEPYDRDPVVIVPGILGSWTRPFYKGGPDFMIDPMLRTYDDLINTLRLNGYVDGQTLFTFPYQWRQSNTITWKQFAEKINQIQDLCKCTKVDVVAHSMGGLVTRAYVQSDVYENDIDQVIFLGTPHKGAPKAYMMWEGGIVDGKEPADFLLALILRSEAWPRGQFAIDKYIQEKVRSVEELLPIFNYLLDTNSAILYKYNPCHLFVYPCNDFLEELDKDSHLVNQRVRTVNYVIDDQRTTLEYIEIEPLSAPNLSTGDISWYHGIPVQKWYSNGDGTVPTKSASLDQNNVVVNGIDHTYLSRDLRAHITADLLGVDKKLVKISPTLPFVKRLLFISKRSPINMSLLTPKGEMYGYGAENQLYKNIYYTGAEAQEGEYLITANPENGVYTAKAAGNGTGEYSLAVSLISDNSLEQIEFTSTATPTSTHEFEFIITDDNELILPQITTDTQPQISTDNESSPSAVPPSNDGVERAGERLSANQPRTNSVDFNDQKSTTTPEGDLIVEHKEPEILGEKDEQNGQNDFWQQILLAIGIIILGLMVLLKLRKNKLKQ